MVSYDAADKAAGFAARRGIAYPLLSDPESEIIRAFGVLDETQAPGGFSYGIARPIIFVIDADGFVRHRFSETGYQRRPEPADVFAVIRAGG